jgi:hypothetical protein
MKDGCEICRPRGFAATGGHLVWQCYSTGLILISLPVWWKKQYEMLIHVAVTFNILSSDSYVLFVHWWFIVAAGFFICLMKTAISV